MTGRPGLPSARRDEPHISPEWELRRDLIDGVRVREVRNVITHNGRTTEVFREDWGVVDRPVEQIIHVVLRAGAISAWHMHERKTDHLFVIGGHLKVVLFDGRVGSRTHAQVDVLLQSPERPMLVVIPPGIWHGLQNLAAEPGAFVNFFDRQYDYGDPDDWRLPPDTGEIPYRF